jgi:nitronate monooxygenase
MRAWAGHEDAIAPFPAQNELTRPLRTAAAAADDARYLSLWAGQGSALARDLPAAQLVRHLVEEADAVRRRLHGPGTERDG